MLKSLSLLIFVMLCTQAHSNELTVAESSRKLSVLGSFSYIDTWLFGKLGLRTSYGNRSRSFDLAFERASYSADLIISDLGRITDQRLLLSTRSFISNGSFNIQYGLSYESLEISLGSEYTDSLLGRYDLVKIDTLNLMWGIGNRWVQKSNWILGVDWFRIFIPITTINEDIGFLDNTTDEDDQDDIQEVVDVIKKIPKFTLLHFEIGYRF